MSFMSDVQIASENYSPNPLVLSVANEISQMAAKAAMTFFRKELDINLKGDESPVTVADIQIEKEAREILALNFPDHAILGEEFGSGDLSKEHVWVIDPIDGTRSFISGHPLFGFLLAYMRSGKGLLGVVSMPALGELYIGEPGHGATLNGVAISVSKQTDISNAILSINEGERLFACEPQVHERLISAGHTRRFGYDCYPHALLAAGHIDGVVDYDLKPFDYLPLVALVEAAGGVMSDWEGKQLSFDSDGRVVSAATPELHRQLLQLLSEGT